MTVSKATGVPDPIRERSATLLGDMVLMGPNTRSATVDMLYQAAEERGGSGFLWATFSITVSVE